MSQIKQLLQLHQQGKGIKFIARSLAISKNTVKAYLARTAALSENIPVLLALEDPVLEARYHAGNPAYKDERFEYLKSRLDYYTQQLKLVGVNRLLLWQEYRQQQPQGYSYTQFCFHLSQHLLARKPSMVLHHQPAEKLFVDFAGKKLSYTDVTTGEVIYCHIFTACLPYSDYSFALAVRSQCISDFLYALGCCLQQLGGVPQVLVPDNLKAAVTKASRYEPDINRAMEDFANHYQTTVIPARARKPKDKALVENQVKLIYTRVYARLRHRQFFDLASLNQAIKEKVKEHNQTRMQQKPWSRQERFLSAEKHLLSPLPRQAFEIKHYRELKVAQNNHVYLAQDKHYYSVPYTYIGTKVKVIYTRSLVHVYSKGEQIAAHVRSYQPSGYSTSKEHLCSHHQHYLERSPAYYLSKAEARSLVLCQLMELFFKQGRHPEQVYRACDGLLSLQKKTAPADFDSACRLAIECQSYSYRFVRNVLENKMASHIEEPKQDTPLPVHQNIRGRDYYAQTTSTF
ncbi:IS21 family transposase [Pontibacter arcticus]|nr:IS21 family transposase [Pontibacter arcticus]